MKSARLDDELWSRSELGVVGPIGSLGSNASQNDSLLYLPLWSWQRERPSMDVQSVVVRRGWSALWAETEASKHRPSLIVERERIGSEESWFGVEGRTAIGKPVVLVVGSPDFEDPRIGRIHVLWRGEAHTSEATHLLGPVWLMAAHQFAINGQVGMLMTSMVQGCARKLRMPVVGMRPLADVISERARGANFA